MANLRGDREAVEPESKSVPAYLRYLVRAIAGAPEMPAVLTANMTVKNAPNFVQVAIGQVNSLLGRTETGGRRKILAEGQQPIVAQKNPRVIKTKPVCLFVDAVKLLGRRSLYCDPEGMLNKQEPGRSFWVLGGIPAGAIVAVSEHVYGPIIPVTRERQ